MSKPDKELYEFSRFSLDVSERLLRRDGKRLPLTDKAFDTLCILVRRSGELVSKDQLMSGVWADSIVEENNLDQKISMLRQVLGDRKGKEKFIETVRGRGYRFLPEVRRVPTEPPNIEDTPKPAAERLPMIDLSTAGEHFETQRTGNVVAVTKWQRDEVEERTAEKIDVNGVETAAESKSIGLSKPRKWVGWALAVAAIAIVVIALTFLAQTRSSHKQVQASSSPIDSVAVLPFENAAQDADAEYLSDGITESLINRLSRLSNLKVMSSDSVFRYKGTRQDLQKAGSELNVKAVLTGSVRQIGDQIVINVSLDDVQDSHRIWGEQYVRKFADVLAVQNDIVREVSDNLRVKLTGVEEQQLTKRYTENVEAYQLYLKGNYEWNKHTQDDVQKAAGYYNQAIALDPNYALAYAGLANCYGLAGNDYLPPHEAFPEAKKYAAKALEIDNTLTEAHVSMAALRLFYDWDMQATEGELQQAMSLDPRLSGIYDIYSAYWDARGQPEKALPMSKNGQELDPLSLLLNANVGNDLYYLRQYDEAAEQLKKTIDLEPHYDRGYLLLGQVYCQKKMYSEAIEMFQRGMIQVGRDPEFVSSLGNAYAMAGEREKALKTITELNVISEQRYVSPYLFAAVYAGLGNKDQTLVWLEKAYQDRSSSLLWLKIEPQFDPLRDDPRFQDLLGRIGP